MRLRLGVAVALLAVSCKVEEGTFPSAEKASRIFPRGQGKFVRFDIAAKPDETILITSKNIEAQRDYSKLVVHFEELVFEVDPARKDPVELDEFIVRVFKQTADNNLESVAESEEQDLNDQELNAGNRRHTVRGLQVAIPDVGALCDSGCVLAIEADYWGKTARSSTLGGIIKTSVRSGSDSESDRVVLNLLTGVAKSWTTGAPAQPVEMARGSRPAIADPVVGGCGWLTEAEATAAMGQPMRYTGDAAGALHCTLNAVDGSGAEVFLAVHDAKSDIDFVRPIAEEVEDASVGDRAIWLPRAGQLHFEKGDLKFSVRTAPQGQAPADPRRSRQQALTIANAMLRRAAL